ncbi:MAG: cyclic nucleotide-binding domain-containing protein [Proteobacteria bacterium]|nr:cyclic nucleotide-binding domain-containing protein [Pseudomonadota bacterium]
MQLIGTNGSTGVLKIMNKYVEKPGAIYFVDGKMVDAEAGSQEGIEAVYSLFGWVEGAFEFIVEPVNRANIIKENRMEIILNGLRMLDDGKTPKLGPEQLAAATGTDNRKAGVPVIRGPLIDYMYVVDEDTYDNGNAIVEQGKHGGWIWVILEGIVEIEKQTPNGPVTILQLGTGAFIGSISTFLMQGAARSATAKAVGEVQLGVLDSQLLSKEFTMLTAKMKDVILSLDKRLKSVTNSAADQSITDMLKDNFDKEKRTEVDHEAFQKSLFTITSGEVYIVAKTENGIVPLMLLEESDFIGQLSFLDFGYDHEGITYYHSDDFKTEPLNLEMLHNEFNRLSETFKNIIDNMVSCISITTNIAISYIKKNTKKTDIETPQKKD